MDERRTPRQDFLKGASLGLAATPILSRLQAARQTFRDELSASVEAGPAGFENRFENLGDAYSLDPAVTYLNHGMRGTVPRQVQAAQRRYLEICETNPWLSLWGGPWDGVREEVRGRAAGLLGCDASQGC